MFKIATVAVLALMGTQFASALGPVLPYNNAGYEKADMEKLANQNDCKGKAFAQALRSITGEQNLATIFSRVQMGEVNLAAGYTNTGFNAKGCSIDPVATPQPFEGIAAIYTAPDGSTTALAKANCVNPLGVKLSPPVIGHNEPPPAPTPKVCLDSRATNFQGFLPCVFPQIAQAPPMMQQQQQIAPYTVENNNNYYYGTPQQEQVVYPQPQYYGQPAYYPMAPQYASYQEPYYGTSGYGSAMTFAPSVSLRIGGGNMTTNVINSNNRSSSSSQYYSSSNSNSCNGCNRTSNRGGNTWTTTPPTNGGGPVSPGGNDGNSGGSGNSPGGNPCNFTCGGGPVSPGGSGTSPGGNGGNVRRGGLAPNSQTGWTGGNNQRSFAVPQVQYGGGGNRGQGGGRRSR